MKVSRRVLLKLFVMSAVAVMAMAYYVSTAESRERAAHRKQRERVWYWIRRARDAGPPAGVHAGVWQNLLVALDQALGNPLGSPQAVSTQKIRELADALDASQGRQLATLDGAIAVMEHMEQICPNAAGYFSFANARIWIRDFGPQQEQPNKAVQPTTTSVTPRANEGNPK